MKPSTLGLVKSVSWTLFSLGSLACFCYSGWLAYHEVWGKACWFAIASVVLKPESK